MPTTRQRRKLEDAHAELKWRMFRDDPEFFFRECIMIPVPPQVDKRGRTELELYDYQLDDLAAMREEQYLVILKARQIGISTLVAAYVLWYAIFHPGAIILWISKTDDDAKKAVGMLKVMWTFLPQWVKDKAPRRTRDQTGWQEWTFANGMTSRIRTLAPTAGAGAGETATLAIFDEAAVPEAEVQEQVHRALTPTTDAGGSLWLISTARGGYNRFAKTYRRAARGESIYKTIFHPWMVSRYMNRKADLLRGCQRCNGTGFDPEPGEGLERYCRRCVDTAKYAGRAGEFAEEPWLFASEYPALPEEAFRESGRPRFVDLLPEDETTEDWVIGDLTEDLDFEPDLGGNLHLRSDVVMEGPDLRRQHVLHFDTAQGVGGDYTAGTVMAWDDDGDPEILAWWHSNQLEEREASWHADKLGRFFGNALLSVEVAGGNGVEMVSRLMSDYRYPRLYRDKPSGKRGARKGNVFGLRTTHASKPKFISRLASYLRWNAYQDGRADAHIQAISPLLRFELSTFVRTENGKEQADTGTHDDLVMSLAGALWVLTEDVPATAPVKTEEEPQPDPGKITLDDMAARRRGEIPKATAEETVRRERRSTLLHVRR